MVHYRQTFSLSWQQKTPVTASHAATVFTVQEIGNFFFALWNFARVCTAQS